MNHLKGFTAWSLFIALILAGCGGGVESDIEEAENTLGAWSPELAERMSGHMDDPRVPDLIMEELDARSTGGYAGTPPDPAFDILGRIVIAHPPGDKERLSKVVVRLVVEGVTDSARTWLADYETSDSVRSYLKEFLEKGMYSSTVFLSAEQVDRGIGELKTLSIKPDDAWIQLVLAAALNHGDSEQAVRYLESGFPPDGKTFADEERVPFAKDPRAPRAVLAHVVRLGKGWHRPDEPHLEKLAELVRATIRPKPDTYLNQLLIGLIQAGAAHVNSDFSPVAAAGGDDSLARLDQLAQVAVSPKEKSSLLRLRSGLGDPDLSPALMVVLAMEERVLSRSSKEYTYKESQARSTESRLRGLKGDLTPGLKRALDSKSYYVRQAGINVWAGIEPKALAVALNSRIGPGKQMTWANAETAMKHLGKIPGLEVDEFLMRSLYYGQKVTKKAAQLLRSRLKTPEFVKALFGFLVRKQSFAMSEVQAYTEALGSYPGVGVAVAQELGKYIEAAGGRPERVYWMVKVLSIRTLASFGDASAGPVLEKVTKDTSSYVWTNTKTNPTTGAVLSTKKETIKFADEAAKALRAIAGRGR